MAKYVIDISEEDYLAIQEGIAFVLGMRSGKTIINRCMDGIKDATPLEKVLEDIKAEIKVSKETLAGKYDRYTSQYDMPSRKIERNEVRQQCIDIINKHISGKEK